MNKKSVKINNDGWRTRVGNNKKKSTEHSVIFIKFITMGVSKGEVTKKPT